MAWRDWGIGEEKRGGPSFGVGEGVGAGDMGGEVVSELEDVGSASNRGEDEPKDLKIRDWD